MAAAKEAPVSQKVGFDWGVGVGAPVSQKVGFD